MKKLHQPGEWIVDSEACGAWIWWPSRPSVAGIGHAHALLQYNLYKLYHPKVWGGSLKYKPRPYWTGMLVLLPSLLASPVYCNQPSNLYYGCSLERPRRGRADTNRPATFTNGGTTISSYGYLGFLGLGLGAGAAAVEGACRGAGMMGGCTLLLPLSFSCACLFHSCCYRRARWAGLGFCRPWHVLAGRLGTRRRGLWFSEPVSVIPLLESSDL